MADNLFPGIDLARVFELIADRSQDQAKVIHGHKMSLPDRYSAVDYLAWSGARAYHETGDGWRGALVVMTLQQARAAAHLLSQRARAVDHRLVMALTMGTRFQTKSKEKIRSGIACPIVMPDESSLGSGLATTWRLTC